MLIIASCSSTKRINPSSGLNEDAQQAIDLRGFASNWVASVRTAKNTYFPADVYAGIGFTAIQSAASCLDADIQFVSAGMSVVESNKKIPGYNLTISDTGPTPFSKVDISGTSADWWDALNQAYGHDAPLYNSIKNHDGYVYVALPSSYLVMVKAELIKAVTEFSEKVRIITSNKNNINASLVDAAIRYDQRLNKMKNGPSGANFSFTQRALLNFARLIKSNKAESLSVAEQQFLVDESFKDISDIGFVKRAKVSEDQLLAHVQDALGKQFIPRSKLLANLRHVDGIACEQGRFYKVYEQAIKLRA